MNQTTAIEEMILTELRSIKDNVTGVLGSVVATSDGFLIAHDLPDGEPQQVAALAATTHALALRATLTTGRGQFHDTVTRGSHGYLAIYSLGDSAVVTIIGTPKLNVGMLQFHARDVVSHLAEHTTEFTRWSSPPPAQPAASDAGPAALPRRRTAGTR
jgi:uncharacterized protein